MIYEVEVRQTTAGRILIKANSLEEADEAIVNNDAEIINAEDVL